MRLTIPIVIGTILLPVGLTSPASAQAFIGVPAVDSASVARAAWSSAVRASRARDFPTARAEIERAASAWPTQPTYAWSRATLAASLGDTAGVERALRAYAALGLGRELNDTVFDRFRSLAWFGDVRAGHDRLRAPLARSRIVARLSDSTFWPEGVDLDRRRGAIYVSSVRHGTVLQLGPDGTERVLWPPGGGSGGGSGSGGSLGAALAVRVDPDGERLWVTVSSIEQWSGYAKTDSSASLLVVRIADGRMLRRWDLPRGNHVLGDVAIAANGDVLFSDSGEPVLYRLRRGADSLESFRDPLFRSLQGVAPAGAFAYVADYSHGILRVDLSTRRVTRVSDAPNSTSLGVDGLAYVDGALIAIQNGVTPPRVMRFELDRAGDRIVAAHVLDRSPAAHEPTIGAIVGDELVYVANSLWGKPPGAGERPLLLAAPIAKPVTPASSRP